ncbi:MAG: hypothetical protein JWL76_2033 [Thermoleophilia bacterium]|nr:hypothetical protein [Thermoleophilia bacterium]
MLASTVSAPVTSIMPGGCYHPLPTGPSGCWDTRPTEPKPWERNCWDPTKWGTPIQLPSPDAEIQVVEGAKLVG